MLLSTCLYIYFYGLKIIKYFGLEKFQLGYFEKKILLLIWYLKFLVKFTESTFEISQYVFPARNALFPLLLAFSPTYWLV